MKKILAVLFTASLVMTMQPADAATKVRVLNADKVSTKNGLVTISVSGLPAEHGIYISQCMAIPAGATEPTACNPAPASKLWVSNVSADQKMGAIAGKGQLKLKVDKYFKDGDCIHTKCIIFISNDHNASADKSENQAIPFKFAGFNLF
jgi:hypothetical protein